MKLFRWFRRLKLWTTSSRQCVHSSITSQAEFFGKTSNHPGDSYPSSPDLVPWDFRLFSKLKSPLKGKRFETIDEIQENTMEHLMTIGKTVWGPNVPTLKGTKTSLSYVQCFLYLVSSSVNISIFHITWLDTFWTDLVCMCVYNSVYVLYNIYMEFIYIWNICGIYIYLFDI